MNSKWFLRSEKSTPAKFRLFCFPYAGGGASTYLSWDRYLPDSVELIIVQPPGRGSHMSVSPYTDMESLVRGLLSELAPLIDRPYFILGHSLGSRVAFELVHQLSLNHDRLPDVFIASGSRSPDVERSAKSIYHLPKAEFIAELTRLNGTPKIVLENEELMSLFLPVLRADFKISDKYVYTGAAKFPSKLYVLGGKEDVDIPFESLDEWKKFFIKGADIHMFNGGHFFIDTNSNEVVSLVRRILIDFYNL